jgi:hypothetical protein
VTHCTLGNNPERIFEHFNDLDLHADEYISFHEATGIEIRYPRRWRIGIANKPFVICNQLYPKHTVAVFQGKTPNSRFAVFNVDYMDDELLSSYLPTPPDEESDNGTDMNDVSNDNNVVSVSQDDQQQSQDDEFAKWQIANELRERLKEFISHANPVSDEDFDEYPLCRLWNQYMISAAKSRDLANRALRWKDDWSAFWHAVHAMTSYGAAHAIVKHTDEQAAYADASFVCFNVFLETIADYPELYNAFAKRPSK